jgi:hypothetical protein
MKHQHSELIKAWADGAVIQRMFNTTTEMWVDDLNPYWFPGAVYRIKPRG